MKRTLLAAVFSAFLAYGLAAGASAAWWAEDGYVTGSAGLTSNSITLFSTVSTGVVAGANVSYYSNSAPYNKRMYSFRMPVMYSAHNFYVSLKLFVYPVSPSTHSGAAGGKLSLLTSLGEESEDSYLHLTVSGAWARQRALLDLGGGPASESFSESALELAAEKSFFNQFFFQASAAAFLESGKAKNTNMITPALDHSDLASMGTFLPVTDMPEWVLTAQVARDMKPEYDSHLYAGYSKISFRQGRAANSAVAGIKLSLNEKITMDLAYNAYKADSSRWKNYYKMFLQVFF